MSKRILKSLFIMIFLLNFSTLLYANYYTDIRKIEKKIYVTKKQQKMLHARLAAEKKKAFNDRTVRAYKSKIASIHHKEIQYKLEKNKLIKRRRKQVAYERKKEKKRNPISSNIYANYYTDIRKIDRKIYVTKKQQKMLYARLAIEKKKVFSDKTIKAYKSKIASIHHKEIQYKLEKNKLIKRRRKQEAHERKKEKQLDSISGDIYVNINLQNQTMNVYKGSTSIYSWLCSTGKNGYKTPKGSYTPYHTVKMHYSKQWDDAPMPYSVFFHNGFAVHGTSYVSRLGRRASHGCVRLSTVHAKKFYTLTRKYGYKRVHIDIIN